jgi:hypothetical protein
MYLFLQLEVLQDPLIKKSFQCSFGKMVLTILDPGYVLLKIGDVSWDGCGCQFLWCALLVTLIKYFHCYLIAFLMNDTDWYGNFKFEHLVFHAMWYEHFTFVHNILIKLLEGACTVLSILEDIRPRSFQATQTYSYVKSLLGLKVFDFH